MIKVDKNGKKKNYIIYTRCSTDEQAQGDYTTLDAQAHHCKNMLDAFGYDLAEFGKKGIINDDGYSAKDLNRPGIQSILQSINNKREFDGIIFFRLDRLTRNTRDLYSMIDLFKQHDVDFISVRENLDSSTAIGRVVIGILGILSAFERELTGERVKASAIARARQGFRVGGTTPIGYKLINDGAQLPNGKQPKKVVIDENLAPHIQMIWKMAANNNSLSEIGQALIRRRIKTKHKHYWRRQSVALIIKNPFYKGYIKYSGEIHRGKHEPIIDERTWDKANAVLSAKLPGRRIKYAIEGYAFLLGGLIKCGVCGSHLVSVHSAGRDKKRFFYYECARSRQGLGCSYKRIAAPVFDQALIDYFRRASQNQEIIIRAIGKAIRESQIKLESIEAILNEKIIRLNTLRHEVENMLNLAMKDSITVGKTYKTRMNDLETEIASLEVETDQLESEKKAAQMGWQSGEYIYSNIKLAMEHIDQASMESQKNLLRALIEKVIVYEDKIAINMFIQNEALPDAIPKPAEQDKNPTLINDQNEVYTNAQPDLAFAGQNSTGRQVWGE